MKTRTGNTPRVKATAGGALNQAQMKFNLSYTAYEEAEKALWQAKIDLNTAMAKIESEAVTISDKLSKDTGPGADYSKKNLKQFFDMMVQANRLLPDIKPIGIQPKKMINDVLNSTDL